MLLFRALAVSTALLIAAAVPSAAHANPFKNLGGVVPLPKPKVNVHNYYPHPIIVRMDNGREEHRIAPGGVATFTKAGYGDNPTFHALRVDDRASITSRGVGVLHGNKTLNFGK